MDVSFRCTSCEQPAQIPLALDATSAACPHCGQTTDIPADAVRDERLTRCLLCPGTDLFVRKDFPQRLGVAIVIIGFVASTIAYAGYNLFLAFAFLFAVAAIDLILFFVVGNCLMCYRCGARYRHVSDVDSYSPFSLETHEKHRQMEARLGTHPSTASSGSEPSADTSSAPPAQR